MDDDVAAARALLRDPATARGICWITLPEMMAVEETADAVSAAGERGLDVHDVIVNRITTPPARPVRLVRRPPYPRRRSVEALRQRLPAVAIHVARGTRPGAARAYVPWRQSAPISKPAAPLRGDTEEAVAPWSASFRPAATGRAAGIGTPGDAAAPLRRKGRRRKDDVRRGGGGRDCAAVSRPACASRVDRSGTLAGRRARGSGRDALAALHGGPRTSSSASSTPRGVPAVRQRYAAAIDLWFDRLARDASGSVGVDASLDSPRDDGLMDLAPPGSTSSPP